MFFLGTVIKHFYLERPTLCMFDFLFDRMYNALYAVPGAYSIFTIASPNNSYIYQNSVKDLRQIQTTEYI